MHALVEKSKQTESVDADTQLGAEEREVVVQLRFLIQFVRIVRLRAETSDMK